MTLKPGSILTVVFFLPVFSGNDLFIWILAPSNKLMCTLGYSAFLNAENKTSWEILKNVRLIQMVFILAVVTQFLYGFLFCFGSFIYCCPRQYQIQRNEILSIMKTNQCVGTISRQWLFTDMIQMWNKIGIVNFWIMSMLLSMTFSFIMFKYWCQEIEWSESSRDCSVHSSTTGQRKCV